MTEATGNFNAQIKQTPSLVEKITAYAARFDILTEGANWLSQSFDNLSRSGITLDSQMHDLSAVAGVTSAEY